MRSAAWALVVEAPLGSIMMVCIVLYRRATLAFDEYCERGLYGVCGGKRAPGSVEGQDEVLVFVLVLVLLELCGYKKGNETGKKDGLAGT
jgi:hypothetical protein